MSTIAPTDGGRVSVDSTVPITPRYLRDVEIRDALRGYNRDDVNTLLERAAQTIEALEARVRQLEAR